MKEVDVQGITYSGLAQEFGTPLYVYDGDRIQRQIERLRAAFDGIDLRLFYAVKALGNPAILQLMRSEGIGLDTVSINEIKMGKASGFESGEMIFTANAISFADLVAAHDHGAFVNIDSLGLLEKFGAQFGSGTPCSIRVNGHLRADEDERSKRWHLDCKFGISIDEWAECLAVIRRHGVNVTGIHLHTSSQILDEPLFAAALDLALELSGDLPGLQFVNLGGGISPPFHSRQEVPDIVKLAELVRAGLARAGQSELQIYLEPGRYLVSEAGVLLTRVTMRKRGRRHDFVGVDTGFNHLLRPAMYDAWHTIVNLSNPEGELRRYSVVGNLCETDFLARDRELPVTEEGDLLAILNSGAYGFTMASQYNHRPRPAEVLVHAGKAHLIRRRETLEDLEAATVALRGGVFDR